MVSNLSFEKPSVADGEVEKYSFSGEGTTVLAFFPGAFTPACTEEMCTIQDSLSRFHDLDAEVIGISVDTPFALKKFAEENDLGFRLVSDADSEIASRFGIATSMPGLEYTVAKRSIFVVEDGEIIHSEIKDELGELPDFNRLEEVLSS